MFGRRKTPPPQQAKPSDYPDAPQGHAHVLALLDRQQAAKPLQRVQLVGAVLWDLACKTLNEEGRGIRIENLLALLASVGGQQCLLPILAMLGGEGRPLKDVGMVQAKTEDGNVYFFGDASNRLLAESELSLISLAFGAARDCGAPVSMEMIHAEMQHVASLIGDDEALFRLDLPEPHAVDSPLNWAAHFSPMFVEACDLYRLPPMERATAFGFALQRAIIEGKDAIDPMIAARIILSCAMRTSKIDPHRLSATRSD